MSASRFCPACGAEVRPTARFCHRCGAGMDGQRPAGAGAASTTGGTSGGASNILPWSVAGIALLCLLAFIVGQNFRKAPAAPAAAAGPFAGAAGSGGAPGRAPDISQMGPEERADRLFQRVMTYVAEGKSDSVQFFSPMAIQSMQALAPLDAHRRYDLGLLGMVSGDAAMARAQADSILSAAPNHLLGLVLAMRTAGMQLDSTARRGYATRFVEVVDRERASGKQEYVDHGPDIDAALREARGGQGTR
ncbi:MAG: zinc ribbon domain-containing protein [Gemmatimonadota bacterium]